MLKKKKKKKKIRGYNLPYSPYTIHSRALRPVRAVELRLVTDKLRKVGVYNGTNHA